MAENPEVVTYDGLPASAGGAHALRTKNPRAACAQVQRWMAVAVQPRAVPMMTFRVWAGGPADITAHLTAFAEAQLGGPQRQDRSFSLWRVREHDVDAVLDTLSDAGSAAVTQHGHPLASLEWNAEVALIDPATGHACAGITETAFGGFAVDGYGRKLGASGVRATFGTTGSTLSLWLNFPGDDRLAATAAHLQEQLPVKLSAKHWRRWRVTRDGQSYRSAKIVSPVGSGKSR